MSRDATGVALAALTAFAGAPWANRFGLRKPVERLAYRLTKTGFQAISTTTRTFARQHGDKVRLNVPGETTDLFDLNITDEQQMFRDSLRDFALQVLRPAAHAADEALAIPDDIRTQAADLGLAYFAVPEALGGSISERSTVTNMLIAEDLAYGDMGLALALLAPVSVANAITAWGTGEQQRTYLPAFTSEQAPIATIAINEPVPLFHPGRLSTRARRQGNDYVLNGRKTLVPLAADAALFLVAAQTDTGPAVFIVEAGAAGLLRREDRGMGLRAAKLGELLLDNVRVPAANRLGEDQFDYQRFLAMGSLGWCALAVGTAQAVLDYVIPYANEREAFGEPISHRQGVAFMIANIAIELDSMRILTQRACSRAEHGIDFLRDAQLARILCAERAMEIGTNGVQLLGGHGFTKEHPVERWYRDLRAVGVMQHGLHL